MKKFFEGIIIGIIFVIVVAITLFLNPIIYISFGYLGGLVVKWLFGDMISIGFNLLLGTDRFQPQYIPIITATLALIGSYFKTFQSDKKDK